MNRRRFLGGLLGAAVCAVARIYPTPAAPKVLAGGMFIGETRVMTATEWYLLSRDVEFYGIGFADTYRRCQEDLLAYGVSVTKVEQNGRYPKISHVDPFKFHFPEDLP